MKSTFFRLALLLLLTAAELPGQAQQPGAAAEQTPPPAARRARWSVALTVAPEHSFFELKTPTLDSASAANRIQRTDERGRGGYNAALLTEYRLTDCFSLGLGAGLSAYRADLRLRDDRTTARTRLDSVTTIGTEEVTTISKAFSISVVVDSVATPILNFNNQIIGYDYVLTSRTDTIWVSITTKQFIVTTNTTYTPVVTTHREVRDRLVRPTYRFFTVPVLLRYRVGRATAWAAPGAPRWWADVALGAQLQFFLGGNELTTLDGHTYQATRIGAHDGPFRPFNVALTGAVALNYALTPHLSASLAPTLRHQTQAVYRASTTLPQRPTAVGLQAGLKLTF